MAKRKTHKRITTKSHTRKVSEALTLDDSMTPALQIQAEPKPRKTRTLIFLLILGLLTLLLVARKELFLAGLVNSKPIFTWELNSVLRQRFGKQLLERMITEELIADAARKSDISVTKEETEAKEQEIVGSLGSGASLDDLLRYQGITKADFDQQIKLQLTVQKILAKDTQITEDDISNFIATNAAILQATEEAKLREEARQAILDQKVGEKLQPWFNELKESARILRFL